MKLSGEQIKRLHQALLSAFPDAALLRMLVMTELEENLTAIAGGTNLSGIVFDLIEWAMSQGRLSELIQKAYQENPGNPELRHCAEQFLGLPVIAPPAVSPTFEIGWGQDRAARQEELPRYVAENAQIAMNTGREAPVVSDTPVIAPANPTGIKVVILYRRKAKPDDYVLELLERALTTAGHNIFIDRHLTTGTEWAEAIRHEVTTADAVIPLISQRSIGSEMMEAELKTAQETAKTGGGKPRILPVRIAFEDLLPLELGEILDALQYSLWKSPDDDDRIVEEILAALQEPPQVEFVAREATGGAVPLDSAYYIERRADREMEEAIAAGESIILVKGARQVGKTSLLARGRRFAEEAGCRVVFTDFQSLMQEEFDSAEKFCRALCISLKLQLDLDVSINKVWDEDLSAVANLHQFVRRRVLKVIPERIVWEMDEVDKLFAAPFSGDIFALFRVWHNSRATEPNIPWGRLTLPLSYATEASLFIRDLNQSPFNVGVAINLADFSTAEVDRLNERYGSPLRSGEERERLMALINGQPFLTRRALDKLARRDLSFDELERQAVQEEGPFGDHLHRLLFVLTQDTQIREGMMALLHNGTLPSEEVFHRLRSGGVIRGGTRQNAVFRCGLYRRYLALHFG